MQAPKALCFISGMAGSRQGWQEAPYCPCPGGFSELRQHLLWLQPERIALVPGMRCTTRGPLQIPDVMRGEEVQIFGALQLTQQRHATLILPGTHSKWVQVRDQRIAHFQTCMTGELFALLSQHSILSKTLDMKGDFDATSFLQGVENSQQGHVLHQLFSVRTLGLFDRMTATVLPSYLSGLLIGEELRNQTFQNKPDSVILIGNEVLTLRYRLALKHLGIHSQTLGAEATWAGLFALASATDFL
jgi:2-dehydro-3-deoxygalactonokinase